MGYPPVTTNYPCAVTGRTRRETVRGGVVIAAATGLMNAATYAFTLLCAHRLGPVDYGAFAAMLGLVIVVNVLSLSLQATAARRVAAAPGDRQIIEARVMGTSVRAGLLLALVCVLGTPLLTSALRLDSWLTAGLLAVPAFCFAVMGGQAGILQGEHRWVPLAAVFASLGIARLAVGAAAIALWPTSLGAMVGGVAIAALVPVTVGAVALRRARVAAGLVGLPPATGRRHTRVLREVVLSSQALLAFFALATVDIVVARSVLDEHHAGLYAAGLILVKGVQFLPQFVIVVGYPAMARHGGNHHLHLWGLALVLLIGGIATAGVAIWQDAALAVVGGPLYAEVGRNLWLFAVVGTLLAAVQLLVYSSLAKLHHAAVGILWVAVAVIAVAGFVVSTGPQLLAVVAAVDVLLLVVLVAVTRRDDVDATTADADPLTAEATAGV